jgi:hypothetical protein
LDKFRLIWAHLDQFRKSNSPYQPAFNLVSGPVHENAKAKSQVSASWLMGFVSLGREPFDKFGQV